MVEPLFKKLGSLFGVFMDFDDETIERKRLDVARIQVSTVRRGLIDEMVNLKVMRAAFQLWVMEEYGGRRGSSEWREVEDEDASSVGSREEDVIGGEEGLFSDAEECPLVQESVQPRTSTGQPHV